MRSRKLVFTLDTIRTETLLLGALAVGLSLMILSDVKTLAYYKNLESGTIYYLTLLVVGMLFYVLSKYLLAGKQLRFESDFAHPNFLNASIFSFVGFIIIFVIYRILLGLEAGVPEVTNFTVISFFIVSAISEEFVYRFALAEVLYRVFSSRVAKNSFLPIFLASLLSATIFAVAHRRYWGIVSVFTYTFLMAFLFSYVILRYKTELPVILVHVINNIVAANALFQS